MPQIIPKALAIINMFILSGDRGKCDKVTIFSLTNFNLENTSGKYGLNNSTISEEIIVHEKIDNP